ncbi:alpha/beta fold hydrolase [Desulfatitalea alkaliphila]|uniref:Alpha/beta hydrolase n=1 Tax=Desulfatitalea alkaliphila TaxID=2929485 RepID=A0AA41UHF5_9BACT|nr:alpha/beta hydrolase [Desulfatitalea alkaliphila]MCJ8499560.1 alpha/beta hydrolase [Desulfatitalea alkaliphila]
MAARLLELFFVIDVTDLLPGLVIPTLVIHRRGDRPVPMVHGRELATRIPNARFVLLDGTIHFPWLGNVDDVLLPLFDFLGDHPLPASAPDRQSPAVTAAVAPKARRVRAHTVSCCTICNRSSPGFSRRDAGWASPKSICPWRYWKSGAEAW